MSGAGRGGGGSGLASGRDGRAGRGQPWGHGGGWFGLIYLWHADAGGRNSLYDLPQRNWLRGVVVMDSNGRAGHDHRSRLL